MGQIGVGPKTTNLVQKRTEQRAGLVTPNSLRVVTKYYTNKERKKQKGYRAGQQGGSRFSRGRKGRSQSTYTRRYEYRQEPDSFVKSLTDRVDYMYKRAKAQRAINNEKQKYHDHTPISPEPRLKLPALSSNNTLNYFKEKATRKA